MMQQGKSRIEHTEGSVHDWNFSTAETNGVYILSGPGMKYGRPEALASLSLLCTEAVPNFVEKTMSALFVTSKIEFSNCPILEFKVLQNAFKIKKSQAKNIFK